MAEPGRTSRINRAPVLTLWAAAVAERLGFEPAAPEEVRERRRRLGEGERLEVQLMGRTIPVVRTPEGLRALDKDKPTQPGSVERYLAGKFGADLEAVRGAMQALAGSLPPGGAGTPCVRALRAVPAGRAGRRGRLGCQGGARARPDQLGHGRALAILSHDAPRVLSADRGHGTTPRTREGREPFRCPALQPP
jgi:hypothetical protein